MLTKYLFVRAYFSRSLHKYQIKQVAKLFTATGNKLIIKLLNWRY